MRSIKYMDCSSYHILINGYIDGELSEDEMFTLKSHLQACEGCRAYLKRAETMKTAFKHYMLFQNLPDVPANFAHNISKQLQEIVKEKQPSLIDRISTSYRAFVLHLTEKWAGSLRTRPFAWTTLVSCILIFITGVMLFNFFQFSSIQESLQFGRISSQESIQFTQETIPTLERATRAPESAPALNIKAIPQNEEEEQLVVVAPDPMIRFGENNAVLESEYDSLGMIVASGDHDSSAPEVVRFDEEPFIRVAQNGTGSVENYVYSHILTEVYQGHFVDDAVFVGYVQNAFIE